MQIANPEIDQHHTEQIIRLAPGEKTANAAGKIVFQSKALSGIFLIMVLYTVYLAAPVIMPIVMAILLST